MKKTLVVGTGPSGFSVLNSLADLSEVWVMDGQSGFDDTKLPTNSHLALKMKFGSRHTYVDPKSIDVVDNPKYALPVSYSRGGFGEIWGNGFTPYDISEAIPEANPELQSKVRVAMRELLDLIEFSHSASSLDIRFGESNLWTNSNHFGKLAHNPFFDKLISQLDSDKEDLLFGSPNIFLDTNKCTKCGLCMTGCPYGALFDPGEKINRMALSRKIEPAKFIKGVVKRIEPSNIGVTVFYIQNQTEKSEIFEEVILSTGPLSTAIILMNSDLLPDEFEIPDSQVFYGAFLSKTKIVANKNSQELGQMVCYPKNSLDFDFQISFYSPSKLTRERISQKVFPPFLKMLKIPKFINQRIVPVIGFLPQEDSGKIVIRKTIDGFQIERKKSNASIKKAKFAIKRVSVALRPFGLVNIPLGIQLPLPGSGFHIGASLPLGGNYLDKNGRLLVSERIRVLDASILTRIPAGAHTFLTMALIRALLRELK